MWLFYRQNYIFKAALPKPPGGIMLKWLKRKPSPKNIREYLEEKSKEIESSGWVATALVSGDGLTIFSKQKSEGYRVDRLLPYAIQLFQNALKFHHKSRPGLEAGGFESIRSMVLQYETRELIFVVKGYSEKLDFYLIYAADPESTVLFSADKTIKRLLKWTFEVSTFLDKTVKGKGER